MRTARIKVKEAGYYHCMSRIIERRHILGELEKERFRGIMRSLEGFCCLQILTYTIMTNHFHILVKVPERREISDKELIYRLGLLYGPVRVNEVATHLADLRRSGLDDAAELLKERYTYRMFDISEFFKTLKQKFSQYYNRREERHGTLWEQRFKSILVEGTGHALTTIAAYIDLNAVRAGLVEDPRSYRYCGYGEAVAGNRRSRAGLKRAMHILDTKAAWSDYGSSYRQKLYVQGKAKGVGPDGKPIRCGFTEEQIRKVLDEGGRLPLHVVLHCRVRYFSDGVALGSKEFVERIFHQHREQFSPKRDSGARSMRFADWKGLHTLRALRLNPVSI